MDLSRFFPPSILDQSFGLCITPEDLIFPSYNFHRTSYYRPWKWYMQRAEKDFGSTIQDEKEKFKIALDVQHFEPNEINVKVADKEIIIEGKHEERQDNHGFISRQFKRRYFLPHDCNADSVLSSLSSDGVLTVTADKIKELKTREIIVPIKMCDTCPSKDLKTKTEKKEVTEDIKKADTETSKKRMEIMLKEDHCCLLRPELLGAPSGTQNIQNKKQVDDIVMKTSADKCEQAINVKLSEKVDAACSQASVIKEEKSATCMASTEKSEAVSGGVAATGMMASAACGLTSSTKIDSTASGMTSTDKIEQVDALLCGLSSAGKSEKAESLVCGMSSAGKAEEIEKVSCGITSEVLTEKAETSAASMSGGSCFKSSLNETIQIQESSTSYSSSMASSIKETTEKISGIVNDISAQLKEAAENI